MLPRYLPRCLFLHRSVLRHPRETIRRKNKYILLKFLYIKKNCGIEVKELTFSTKADLIPTANSLSAPPNHPTGPAYIPRSNTSAIEILSMTHTLLNYYVNNVSLKKQFSFFFQSSWPKITAHKYPFQRLKVAPHLLEIHIRRELGEGKIEFQTGNK